MNYVMNNLLSKVGVKHVTSADYKHSQNGIAERAIRYRDTYHHGDGTNFSRGLNFTTQLMGGNIYRCRIRLHSNVRQTTLTPATDHLLKSICFGRQPDLRRLHPFGVVAHVVLYSDNKL